MRNAPFTTSLGVCIKDQSRKVSYQNETCISACGDKVGGACKDGCMRYFDQHPDCPRLDFGAKLRTRKILANGLYYDLIILNDGRSVTTLLYRIEPALKTHELHFAQYGLTRREIEVLSFVLEGFSNLEISKKLFISKATLRTHLNNIYKKLPDKLTNEIRRRGNSCPG